MASIAIVGSGFSGSILAAHLARAGDHSTRIFLIDRTGRFGPGVAYGTTHAAHLLNVPAGRMSAFEDDGDHFLRWAKERDANIQGGSFVSRALYGQYISSVLEEAERNAPGRSRRVPEAALAVRPSVEGVEIETPSGVISVDRAVLAIGNAPPGNPAIDDPSFFASPRYTRDPWSGDRLREIPFDAPVLLIGTGLTMFDVVMELRARGHRGPIRALSRRGLLAQSHRSPSRPYHRDRPGDLDLWPSSARGMFRRVRRAVQEAAGKGVDWREVITSLRADTPVLWRRLGERGQAQFLRHLRAYWDTHRHRSAPECWALVESLMKDGTLTIHAGRIVSMTDVGVGVDAVLKPRGEDETRSLRVAHVVNCTGPEIDPRRIDDPLIRDLLERGIGRADVLGIGLESTLEYRVVALDGSAWRSLFLLGPMARPLNWETTAVPELRTHARRLSERLLAAEPEIHVVRPGMATRGA
jgi:uncharacterized NAD(P)/FAD-binding protein YdhS